MNPASESEGEIIETEHAKATTVQPPAKSVDIDRKGRHETPASVSSSFSERSNNRYRSRSRSPYRARSPRGEKRRRDEGPYERDRRDARRFKARYEDSGPSRNRRERTPPYAGVTRKSDQRGGHSTGANGRPRARSRSPYRHGSRPEPPRRYDVPDRSDSSNRKGRDYGKYDNGRSYPAASSERSTDPPAALRGAQASPSVDKPTRAGGPLNAPSGSARQGENFEPDNLPAATHEDLEDPSPVLDEAALIEERRKRRAAIKAKFQGSATPLLVQALQQGGESAAASPAAGSPKSRTDRSVSPMVSTPGTPGMVSAPESPAAPKFIHGEDLANHPQQSTRPDDADEPSAADYDPTMDMQEDKAREDLRHIDQPSAAYDETLPDHQDMLLPSTEIGPASAQKADKKEYDMFADDEDDMFAESPKVATKITSVSNAVAIPQAMPDSDLDLRDNWDDPDGYYRFNPRDALDGRFQPQAILGRGMFSAVFRAIDTKSNTVVAIKIIRNNETMRKAGYKEIDILNRLTAADPEDKKHMIRLVSSFDHRGHLCMVFENLSMNLREVLKKFGRDVGLNLKAVRSYARQMFLGLGLLKKCNVLHADLKPDNILVNESWDALKICDLGSAGDAHENEITPYLVSRFYRAPEIIIGMEYGFPIDMWSIGCTLFELFTGKILFTGRSNNQMLKAITECRGKLPPKMLNKGELRFEHFDLNLETFRSREIDKVTGKEVTRMVNISKPTRDLKSRVLTSSKGLVGADMGELNSFIDLLDKCLQLRPELRITPRDALEHRFFKKPKP